jgi:Cft2 family RNA processing exonuclease
VYDHALYAVDLVAEQVAGSVAVGAGAVEEAQELLLLLGELW